MSIVPVKYPLDLTGVKSTNRAIDELHVLTTAAVRVFVPKNGAFFSDTVTVRDAATNRSLDKGIDYYPALLYSQPTQQTGLTIHQIIVVTDPTCGNNVLFDAQMLGGEFSFSWDAILQLIDTLDLDNRKVAWDAIIGKPEQFDPAPHLHDIGDVYGFEYQVAALERIRQAILLGSSPSTKGLFDYVDSQISNLKQILTIVANTTVSRAALLASLGYTPLNRAGDTVDGLMTFSGGIVNRGIYRERIKRQNATTNVTTLDLNVAGIFEVTLNASTQLVFSMTNVGTIGADESISFTLVLKNDNVAGRAVAFSNNVQWSDKTIPPRTSTANSRDEYYFSSFDSGATWTGSLSNENVGQTAA